MSEFNRIDTDIFNNLSSLFPSMGFKKGKAMQWVSPFKLDGSQPKIKRDDKTVASLHNGRIWLLEQGGDNLTLYDWLGQYLGVEPLDWYKSNGFQNEYIPTTASRIKSLEHEIKAKERQEYETIDKKEQQANQRQTMAITLDTLIKQSIPIETGSHQANYLEARGIAPCAYSQARNMFSLNDKSGHHILTVFRDNKGVAYSGQIIRNVTASIINGQPKGVKRKKEWIAGSGKNQLGVNSLACRLFDWQSDTIGICEGFENALSISVMLGNIELPKQPKYGFYCDDRYTLSPKDTLRFKEKKQSIITEHETEGRIISSMGAEYWAWELLRASRSNKLEAWGITPALQPMPLWAVASAGNIASFEPPKHVKNVILFIDDDKAGNKAYDQLKERIGRNITLIKMFIDEVGFKGDWNDYLVKKQREVIY